MQPGVLVNIHSQLCACENADWLAKLVVMMKMVPEFVKMVVPELVTMVPEFVKMVPELVKMVPEFVKMVPEFVKMVPELVKMVPELVKIVPELVKLGSGSKWRCCLLVQQSALSVLCTLVLFPGEGGECPYYLAIPIPFRTWLKRDCLRENMKVTPTLLNLG